MKEKKEKITFEIDKEKNFSAWFTEIVKKAELADIRYNVKGFVVFQPWSVVSMREIYRIFESVLERKGHKPFIFPAVIPEKNFYLEAEHVKGFAPEVFWITHAGNEKLEERLALRPTSETAFYQMFSLWIRSYRDLPFKTYQSVSVFRHETKATRPFLRSREFLWIETHDAFASREEALKQVQEDIETTKEVLYGELALPFHFFQRPQWDKFAGAENTYAADALMPDGKLIQLPSTHFIGQSFAKAFNVRFLDKKGKERVPFTTCYGPAISRIFAAMISIHGDNNGLVFPFKVAPVQVVIVPVVNKRRREVLKKAREILKELKDKGLRVEIDVGDNSLGDKFYFWEMKGVPVRIELGERELKQGKVLVFRRDTKEKELIAFSKLVDKVFLIGKKLTDNLRKRALKKFGALVKEAKSTEEIKEIIASGKIAKCCFCSIEGEGFDCAEVVEKKTFGSIRGIRLDKKETPKGKCVVCGKKAKAVVYVSRSY
jgi:prolyl-tRNA synthetase